jgi:hypothetical protein
MNPLVASHRRAMLPMSLPPRPHGGGRHTHAVLLAEVLDERPADDPERTIVIFMCAYAGDVLAGVLRRSI